jgi:phosphopentomutase
MKPFHRIHLIVMDSVGIGPASDAAEFGDEKAHTLGHISSAVGGLRLPFMQSLGLGNISDIEHLPAVPNPTGCFAKMSPASRGKDTMTGHWELMGLRVDTPFRVFPHGFPDQLISAIKKQSGRGVIGNKAASGTEIITELGEEHLRSGALIVYTSSDSVLQIAAHEEAVPLGELYAICEFCRALTMAEPYKLGRVIARPFVGAKGAFRRTSNRHDYALKPFAPTTLDGLKNAGMDVIGLGKISDIFDGEGITRSIRTASNSEGMTRLRELASGSFHGLSFLNLVDFDALYGHRRDAAGYARALEEFDAQLEEFCARQPASDLILITADHGNDPTYSGTDHTRENVPLLAVSKSFSCGRSLGTRETFADVAATIADNFQVLPPSIGVSFLRDLA